MSHAGTSRTNMEAAFNKSTHGPAAVSPGRRGGTGRRTVSCPESVAYAKHVDYPTATGVRHHEEEHTTTGIYKSKDVDRRDDGRVSVSRIYDNPNTARGLSGMSKEQAMVLLLVSTRCTGTQRPVTDCEEV